ncbi:MAG TPA: FAD-dependent oxidoreductase [Vicinamibacterales bacterium]|nr:FAD-dependent oxidoreductase [Vicinamibacterales bacterium]
MRSVPYFFDTFPRSRRPDYSRQRGEQTSGVVIIGGGLTGCACALAFAGAGVEVVLLEAERLGAGATAASAGLLRQSLDASFQESAARHGLRTARHLWQSFRRASLDFSAALRRAGVRADVVPQDLILLSRDADGARRLAKESSARRDAGLEASWLTARAVSAETGLAAAGGIRTRGEALDPYRACLGLASAAAAKGAQIHEHSRARRIRAGRKSVQVTTQTGVVTAGAVIIATGALPDDLRALRRHFAPTMSYAAVTQPLPAAVRREVGKRTTAVRDTHVPPRLVRWLKDDRVLVAGGERPVVAGRARDKLRVPEVHELMYELTTLYPAISGLQPEWGWDADSYGSPDDLPVIGPHRNFPRHLFALGSGRHGAGTAWLAARVLLRAYLQEPAKGDEQFGFARVL